MRKTVASSGGSFRFDHVADGSYYVVAMIFQPGGVAFEFPSSSVSSERRQSVRIASGDTEAHVNSGEGR